MDPSVTIDIVCVNYFSTELTRSLMQSLERESYRHIVLVDNSDSDAEFANLVDLAAEFDCLAVRMEGNTGFGAAVNYGAMKAGVEPSSFLWVLNPDTVSTSAAGPRLVENLLARNVDLSSPRIVWGSEGDEAWFAGGAFDSRLGRTTHWKNVRALHPLTFLTAAALMIKGSAWLALGGFRDDLFMYWEDADLSLRATKLGFVMGVDDTVTIWHAVGGTSSQSGRSKLFHYYMQRNRIIVLRENFGFRYCLGFWRMVESAKMIMRTRREPEQAVLKACASIRGVFDGFFRSHYSADPLYGRDTDSAVRT